MINKYILFFAIFLAITSIPDNPDVGYRVGKVQSYKELRSQGKSKLYEVVCGQLDDGRPIKLLQLYGTHYEAGFAYGKLMASEINFTYYTFFHSMLDTQLQIKLIQTFLDWQYQSYVRKQLPLQFLDQIRGIKKGGQSKGYKMLSVYFQRILVISSFPGSLQSDIISIFADEFLKKIIGNKNNELQSFIQQNYLLAVKTIEKFIKKASLNCSMFAVWGKRTESGKLFSMRNLDWAQNTGVNQNKLITVWKINDKIPHLTLGYPGVLGALTGMSAAGLTVHEAGLSSHLSTQLGFQWTLRFRYIMMEAKNLKQALKIWNDTNNTLGMNFMIASANDLSSGHPAVVLETMRGYTAFIYDNDPRQNGTIFHDPKTGKNYVAGYSMSEALFRTNHAYDPTINKFKRHAQMEYKDDSMIRYRVLKDGFNWYEEQGIEMGAQESLNMTAILGDKGSEKFMSCKDNYKGVNVISVTYDPENLMMWAGFEYGYQKTFRSACCGVYVEMDMSKWLREDKNLSSQ